MVTADSGPFVFAEQISALIENIDTAATVAAPVRMTCLAEVMEQGDNGDTVGRKPDSVAEHVLIHFHGVLCKPSFLFVMAVAPAREIVRTAEILDDSVRPRTPERADNIENPLLQICIVLHSHP